MPATPDDHSTGAAPAMDPEDALAAAEDAHLAARRAAPAQRGRRRQDGPAPPARAAPAQPGPAQPGPVPAPAGRGLGRRGLAVRPQRVAHLAAAALVAAGWAAVQGFLAVLLVMTLLQLAEGRTGSLGALARLGGVGWLLGHGVPVRTGAGPLGLAPLALSAFAAWRLARAGVQVTRAIRARRTGSAERALTVAVAVAVVYALLGALAAAVLDGPGIGVSAARAALNLGGFGLATAGAGALAATGAWDAAARRAPLVVGDGIRAGMVAALIVLGAGAVLAGVALALAGGDAAQTISAYRTGVAGQAGITLLCLAYAPNAAVWAAAYLVGPGFAVGLQTTVRTTEVSLGPLPAVPLFAGLPDGSLGGAGLALLAVPLAAGMAAGGLLVRRRPARLAAGTRPPAGTGSGMRLPAGAGLPTGARPPAGTRPRAGTRTPAGWSGLLGAAVLAGPVAGLLLGLACAVSSGPLGGGRLAQVGPAAGQVGLVGAGVVAVGAVLGAVATRLATRR
jgi:hypothetical protein